MPIDGRESLAGMMTISLEERIRGPLDQLLESARRGRILWSCSGERKGSAERLSSWVYSRPHHIPRSHLP